MIGEEKEVLKREGKFLPLMEHFYTLQGEGMHAGKAAYFIRLAGCDVGCHWCDVKDSWDENTHPLTDMKALAKEATDLSKTIVITGGEPLMWNLDFLTSKLKEFGATIHIETSGAYSLSGQLDWITLSPKKRAEVKPDVLEKASELKCIIFNNDDFRFAEKHAALVSPDCKLYLQVEWSKKEKMSPLVVEYVKQNPQWQVSVQTHKYLDIP
ncbi:7-carboxy-7-deazaguanine synthase QueE [Moheibacter lacus]|uniref:7-carboxy-7-deazaguanine synthase n=1 Tax=Moheibacter lacus TaxID=2745851 RepID=A0A838ZRL1_9FLAO|nr:7-carboxy-7-deazaguanine synthase QueE [Moheibacter lacus]MBA5629302.1 7-carboxy-7-deazaguanine synthase QueE [Moheibacter lacus]